MEKQKHMTKKGQKVRLKPDGQDALYSHAFAGSEGWVRDQKLDPLGYPLVFIEWDREHWTDNGEPNKWAFESHFEPVVESEGDAVSEPNPNEFMSFMAKAFEEWSNKDKSPDPSNDSDSPSEQPSVNTDEGIHGKFLNALSRATEATSLDGEAFLLVTIHKVDDESGIPLHVPRVYTFYKTAAAGLLAEMQLPAILATSMEDLTINALQRLDEADES